MGKIKSKLKVKLIAGLGGAQSQVEFIRETCVCCYTVEVKIKVALAEFL